VLLDKGGHPQYTVNLAHLVGKRRGTPETLDIFKSRLFIQFGLFQGGFITPLLFDGGQFPYRSQAETCRHQNHRGNGGNPLEAVAAVDLEGVFDRTGQHAVAAEVTVDMPDHVDLVNVDPLRALPGALAAIDAGVGHTGDLHHRHKPALHAGNLNQEAPGTEDGQRPYIADLRTRSQSNEVYPHDHHEKGGKLEDVAQGAQRTEVLAPEETHEERTQDHDGNGRDPPPELHITVKTARRRIKRIEFLTEELTRLQRVVNGYKQQYIFEQPESQVSPPRNGEPHFQLFPHPAQPFAYRTERTNERTEKLAEDQHRKKKQDAHHNLRGGHGTGQCLTQQVTSQGLQPPERTIGFEIGHQVLEHIVAESQI